MQRQTPQESYTQEQLEQEEQELLKKIRLNRKLRGAPPITEEDLKPEKPKVIEAQFKRLDPETGKEQGVLDDLASIGFRDVLANPSDPAAQVAFLKNLKNRPDLIEKARETILTEEFLEKAMIAFGGGLVGFWARGELDKKLKGLSDLL